MREDAQRAAVAAECLRLDVAEATAMAQRAASAMQRLDAGVASFTFDMLAGDPKFNSRDLEGGDA